MNRTKIFSINGKLIKLPLFEKGDRVTLKDNSTSTLNPTGTVEKNDGLFVYIIWDNKFFKSKDGKNIELGKSWMADSVQLIS